MNWGEAGIILALVLLNGFFAGSELALVSARKARLRARADRGHHGSRVALEMLENPTRLLSSIQIGITLIGILTGVYSGAVFAGHLAVVLNRIPWLAPYADGLAFAIVVTLVTYLSLILGELVPKRVALAHAESLADVVAVPMLWVSRIASPLVWLLQVSTDAVTKLLPLRSAPQASLIEDEVRALIATGAKEGVFQRREQEMLEGVLRLADRPVESVMVPRGDIIWLDATAPLQEMWAEARASGHARFLLCEGELEQLIGVITLADLGEALRLGSTNVAAYARPPLHVPATVSLLRLLELFRESHVHLAVVTDEYGGIEGLATPADVLKAIAGELADLGGRERAEAIQREDGSWLIDGQLSIQEAERALGRNDLAHGSDYYTFGGFVLWQLGRVPVAGDTLTWRDLLIEVVDMDGTRIDKLLVRRRATPSSAAA
ncbi:MAG TPA: hemolysin family protein [Steroidobacteraceae bacterium]|nr:hemolysin family protein [Steroidobacteraceae bacterium]